MDKLFNEFSNVPIKPVQKPATPAVFASSVPSKATTPLNQHHPAMQAPYKVEKAYTMQSAGGKITEGCVEHYSERIVQLDVEYEDYNPFLTELKEEDIEKYIIMAEILKPKF